MLFRWSSLRLSQLTGNLKILLMRSVDRIKRFLLATQNGTTLPGMWPTMLDFGTSAPTLGTDYTLGALARLPYEYPPEDVGPARKGAIRPTRKCTDLPWTQPISTFCSVPWSPVMPIFSSPAT